MRGCIYDVDVGEECGEDDFKESHWRLLVSYLLVNQWREGWQGEASYFHDFPERFTDAVRVRDAPLY